MSVTNLSEILSSFVTLLNNILQSCDRSTPMEERGRNRMEQREKSNYDVRTKASADSMGDSEARITLQSCPEWGQEDQVSMLPSGSIIVYRLPQKGSC